MTRRDVVEPLDDNAFRAALGLLAEASPEPAVTDLEAARTAWTVAHPPSWWMRLLVAAREHPRVVLPVLAAAVVALVLAGLAGVPTLRLSAPAPASTPSGPGAVPDRLWAPPEGTPEVTEKPLSRAAYVLRWSGRAGALNTQQSFAAVVGADDGSYRLVPAEAADGVLSADGRRLVWSEADEYEFRGDVAVPQLARLVVLDLPTGTLRTVDVPSRFRHTSSVDQVALDRSGRRVAVVAQDSWDGSSGYTAVLVVDAGPVGSDADLPVERVCFRCSAEVAWLDDGRLGYTPDDEAEVPSGAGVATVALPERPAPDQGGFGVIPGLVVSGDGALRYAVTSQDPNSAGIENEPHTLVAGSVAGEAWRRDLGTHSNVVALGSTDRGVVTTWWDLDQGQGSSGGFHPRIDLLTRTATTRLTTTDDDLLVTAVARGVVEGGRVVAGVRPVAAASLTDRLSSFARGGLMLLAGTAVALAGLALLVLGLTRPWPRTLVRWLRAHRPGRLGAAVVLAALGVGWLAAPAVVEARWAVERPRAEADAPSLLPHTVTDQRVRPPRAFDAVGSPRTVRLLAAFVTTVAERPGIYGIDAGTGRLVRLDDLPGLSVQVQHPGQSGPGVALSPSGRFLVLYPDRLPDRRIAVVDLRTARVDVRSDVVHDPGGDAVDPYPPVAVDDEGAVWSAATRGGPAQLTRWMPGGGAVGYPEAGEVIGVAAQAGGMVVARRVGAGSDEFVVVRPEGVLRPEDGQPGADPQSGDTPDPADVDAVAIQGGGDGETAAAIRTGNRSWVLTDERLSVAEPWSRVALPLDGPVAVASGVLADRAGQVDFGGVYQPWWTWPGQRRLQVLGWLPLGAAGLLVLPLVLRRLRR